MTVLKSLLFFIFINALYACGGEEKTVNLDNDNTVIEKRVTSQFGSGQFGVTKFSK